MVTNDTFKLNQSQYHVAGSLSVYIGSINTKKLFNHTFVFRVESYGGTTKDFTLSTTTGDWTGGDTAAPTLRIKTFLRFKR